MEPEELLDTVPVPAGLELRIRATVEARRLRRYLTAAAAAILIATVALWPSAPPADPPTPVAFAVSLAGPAPEPMPLQETLFTAELDADRNVLVFYLGD